ncbi:ATP-binding protein [Maridesulfovibrio sp.]|uniref:sensor histidine kinase n=1 Tax=Maridesulfovibrio sp. TaxID=2795000 RepID=UPI0029C9C52A|nr:ATP-binding protein [Maridesulfovibrio sp.]
MKEVSNTQNIPGNNHNPCTPEIMAQHSRINSELASEFIDSVPSPCFILNRDRRIVSYNTALTEAVGEKDVNMILGRRPGDLLRCCNSQKNYCGDSPSCLQCGALQAIQTAMTGQKSEEECMLLANVDNKVKAYTFRVNASPIDIGEEQYYIIHLADISDKKHKEMMERVFLHDLLNAINGIANAGTLLRSEAVRPEQQELAEMIVERSHYMANEINAHRLFLSAETKKLELYNEPVDVVKFIESICTFYNTSQLGKGKNVSINSKVSKFSLTTDKRILYRIIENLVKNAVEASHPNGSIKVEACEKNGRALFTISNQGSLPMTVAHQIFKRSFSTKGSGRGLGTYSVKMFTENYLRGRVWFDSSLEDGTNFYVELPLTPSDNMLTQNICPRVNN